MENHQSFRIVIGAFICGWLLSGLPMFAAETPHPRKNSHALHQTTVSTLYTYLSAYDGSGFAGLQFSKPILARMHFALSLTQSVAATETARHIEAHETFVQRATRTLRLQLGGGYCLVDYGAWHFGAVAAANLWRTELSSTVEDTPMGDFYNFPPETVTQIGMQAGLEAALRFTSFLSAQARLAYQYMPAKNYAITYDMMGMVSTQHYRLQWSGLDMEFGIGLRF